METRVWGMADDWRDEDLDALNHEFGLDADRPPRNWVRDPGSWMTVRRVNDLSDELVAFVDGRFDVPLSDPAEVQRLTSAVLLNPVHDKMQQLRIMMRRANGEEASEEPEWIVERVPVMDLLTRLFLLKRGRDGMEWEGRSSLPRLLDIAVLPIPDRPLPPVVADYRFLALEAYVHGHFPAAVMWCRSAVENQVKAALAAREIVFPFETMRERVRTAVVYRALDPALERAARAIFVRGGTTVHKDPYAVHDAVGTARAAMIILDDMQRRWPS